MLTIGLTLPFVLLRLFIRRIFFSTIAVGAALAFDAGIAVAQITVLWVFFSQDLLGGTLGHLAIGISCATAVVYWLVSNRSQYVIDFKEAQHQALENWSFSKSVFISQLLWILHINVVIWSIAFFLGKDVVGEFTASLSTILLANPFVLGLLNILTSRAVKSYGGGGFSSLRDTVFSNMLVMVSGVVVLWIGLIFCGDWLVMTVFGKGFSGQQLMITILGISMIAETACKAPEQGLNAIERPEIVSKVNLYRLAITIVGLAILLPNYGMVGAASTLAVADLFAAILMTSSFVVTTSIPVPIGGKELV
jgi:O-antigen/teichoic acid export membrane protein